MKNVQSARMQLLKGEAKAAALPGTNALPSAATKEIASSSGTLPALTEVQISEATTESEKKTSLILADVPVGIEEKNILENITKNEVVEMTGKNVGNLEKKSLKNTSSKNLNSIFKNGVVKIDDLKRNPNVFNEKSVEEIAAALKNEGYDITIRASTRSRSGAQIIKINNLGSEKNISQVQVSPGGGRHGSSPYVKISTNDQRIIKIVNGAQSSYITDGNETATIVFTGEM